MDELTLTEITYTTVLVPTEPLGEVTDEELAEVRDLMARALSREMNLRTEDAILGRKYIGRGRTPIRRRLGSA